MTLTGNGLCKKHNVQTLCTRCPLCAGGAHLCRLDCWRRKIAPTLDGPSTPHTLRLTHSWHTAHTLRLTLLMHWIHYSHCSHYSRTTLTLLIHCAHTRVLTLLRHCAWHTANTLVLTLQIKSFALYKLHKIVCQSFVWLSDWLFKVVHFTSCIRLSVRQTWRAWKCVDEEILVINDDSSEFKWW